MIGKTKTGRGFGGTIRYCLDDSKNPEILYQNGVSHNSPNGLIHEFVVISCENQNISKPVWHSSLSFANEDKMTDEKMIEIANRFMEKAGFSNENNQWIIIKHNNTKHTHCHIVANRVGFDGKAVGDYYSKSRTVQYAKEIEQEFSLIKAQEIAKSRMLDESLKTTDPLKNQLKTILQKALGRSDVKSFDKLVSVLQKEGVELNLAKHRKTGKVYGISYTFKGKAYKGSDFGKQFTYKGISSQLGAVGISAVTNLVPTLKTIRKVAKIISRGINI